ncbi:phospholipase A [Rheinheimera sp. 1928-s]|uniref:phospholipase A n=1 Tax=Rheinheimera sp. 1928-s TaxID=3033803 RepID=UPI0026114838|nr:phospholipase A [Rheinheimera sp. 1928-s]MDF3127346.1 phospholipase A [Rheinheimera sp. 1928-s]
MKKLQKVSTLTAIVLISSVSAGVSAQDVKNCRETTNKDQRLACYDRIFGTSSAETVETSAATKSAEADVEVKQHTTAQAPEVSAAQIPIATVMQKYWELTPEEKRDRFVFRTYQPNFFLPAHITSNINKAPQSPTRGQAEANENYKQMESKIQVSLRAKLMTELLLPGADLWFAFSQRSMWQLWNNQDSAPFRNTDYQPELMYIVPVADTWGDLPGEWQIRMLQFGIAHQSNGQAKPLSRSWNKVYAGLAVDKGEFGLNWRYNQRISESGDEDDNPDLIDYIGSHEISANWLPGNATAQLTWRNDFSYISRGSWQLDLTYPVDSSKLDGLRWHLQIFSGYGETLLDYNFRQNSMGIGVMLFNF